MRWLILCNECVDEIDEDQIANIFEAKFGRQDADEDADGCVLACQRWDLPHIHNARKFFCEECGEAIAVAPSSQWFIDEHRRERDEM